MYLQFVTLHKCLGTILISSAPPACGFWSLPHIFHKFLEVLHYLSSILPLFLLVYSVPLSGAGFNCMMEVSAVWGMRQVA